MLDVGWLISHLTPVMLSLVATSAIADPQCTNVAGGHARMTRVLIRRINGPVHEPCLVASELDTTGTQGG